MTKKINLVGTFKEPDGSDGLMPDPTKPGVFVPVQMCKTLANQMCVGQNDDHIKFWDWACELHKSGQIEVDDSDYDKIEKFVRECKGLNNAGKAQILKAMKASNA